MNQWNQKPSETVSWWQWKLLWVAANGRNRGRFGLLSWSVPKLSPSLCQRSYRSNDMNLRERSQLQLGCRLSDSQCFKLFLGIVFFCCTPPVTKKFPPSCLSKKILPHLLDLGCVRLLITKLTWAWSMCPMKKNSIQNFAHICVLEYQISKKFKFNINFKASYKILHFHTLALVSLI
jgi:hypothetical protein